MRPDENKKRHIVVCGKGGSDQVQADWNQTDTEQPDYIKNKPSLATVATSGSYNDLTDKPTIPTQVQADWNETDTADPSYIQNKPTIPAAQVNADWEAVSGVAEILNKPTILTQWFGTQAEYDLIDPKDPDTVYHIEGGAPVQSDWDEADNTSLAYIQNKPTIPAAQVNSDWNANSGVAQILNKPTIPTVPAMATETLTFTLQGGTTKTIDFYVVPNYFYVEDISGSSNTLTITKSNSSAPTIEVFKSTDKTNWESMGTTSTTAITATIPANGKLYLKANANALWCGDSNNNTISASGNHNVGGNILSLIYGDNFEGKTTLPTTSYYSHSGFTMLFMNDTKLINANNLILPLTTTIVGVYNAMFWGCTNLVTAPATLPATTLAESCYSGMFRNCTSLTTAPALPATTLAQSCYSSMFNSCTSLNKVVTYAQNISATNCLYNWLNNVSQTGDFFNLGGATYTSGASGIPSGWTEHNSL